jgi:acyl transferase domain-containing protein
MAVSVPIAIICSGCKFPIGASSPSRLWKLLKNPQDLASRVPSDRFDVDAFYNPGSRHQGTTNVQGSCFFDGGIRVLTPPPFSAFAREVVSIDLQQRILLETMYEAIEGAGL